MTTLTMPASGRGIYLSWARLLCLRGAGEAHRLVQRHRLRQACRTQLLDPPADIYAYYTPAYSHTCAVLWPVAASICAASNHMHSVAAMCIVSWR